MKMPSPILNTETKQEMVKDYKRKLNHITLTKLGFLQGFGTY